MGEEKIMEKDYSWMDKTKGGKRESAYTTPPKREKVRTQRGNVAQVIREKNQRTREDSN